MTSGSTSVVEQLLVLAGVRAVADDLEEPDAVCGIAKRGYEFLVEGAVSIARGRNIEQWDLGDYVIHKPRVHLMTRLLLAKVTPGSPTFPAA